MPLKHAFIDIDGETDSKNAFKGEIGKMLPNVEDMKVKESFPAIDPGDIMPKLLKDSIKDLSTDQYMIYLAGISVQDR